MLLFIRTVAGTVKKYREGFMRKLLAVMSAMVLFAGIGFADLNVMFGFDVLSKSKMEGDDKEIPFGNKIGFSVTSEYLYPVNEMVKVGGGLQYLLPRKSNVNGKAENMALKASYLPIYATVQVNPFKEAAGLFLKGNIGYSVLLKSEIKELSENGFDMDKKGGIYFGLGFGYEFENGLIFNAMYGYYTGKIEASSPSENVDIDVKTSQATLNIGYKFAI